MVRCGLIHAGMAVVLAAAAVAHGAAAPAVRLVADRGDSGGAVAVPQLADGDVATQWNSGPLDLRQAPANLFVIFPEPAVVAHLELETVVSKGALRVTAFEVYGRVDAGWALLGQVSGSTATTQGVDLKPCRTRHVRVRLRDNAREGHSWAVLGEIRWSLAEGSAAPAALSPSAVADETAGERLAVAAALGELPVYPRAAFDSERGVIHYARSFVDTLLAAGTDRYGAQTSPMFVSLLLLEDGQHARSVLPAMPGQRQGDRAMFGGNLQHDVPLLLALPHLSRLTGEGRYDEASRAYLAFFLEHCTATPTGLWPWGEHAHWDFFEERPGHTLHEYLGAPPPEFLEAAWALRPQAVIGEADGLLNHVRDLETFQFCRHAEIDRPLGEPRQADRKGLDFPRHGGMFVRLWAFAYSRTGENRYLDWCQGMMRHFTLVRQADGTLPVLSRYSDRQALGPGFGCNLSVGVSLLESAVWLGQTPCGDQARRLGRELLDTLAAAPPRAPQVAFAMAYGSSEFAGADALLRLQAFRLTGDVRHRAAAMAFAEAYAAVEAIPAGVPVRAMVYGILVNLYLDLADLDPNPAWMAAAERYARWGIEDLWCRGLFRGASGGVIYDSECFVSTFVYSLVRLEARQRGGAAPLPPLVYHR